jgi:hypothetical protein
VSFPLVGVMEGAYWQEMILLRQPQLANILEANCTAVFDPDMI